MAGLLLSASRRRITYSYEYRHEYCTVALPYHRTVVEIYLVRIIYVYFIFINFKKLIVNFCRHFSVFWGMFEIY